MDAHERRVLTEGRLFSGISLESVEHLFEACVARDVPRGDHLLEPGRPNSYLYVILAGELRVHLVDAALPEHATFTVGDCVGEMSLLDGAAASALVVAAADTRVLAIPHDVLWSLVDCSHGVARNLLAILSGRMRNDNQAIVLSTKRSQEFEQAATVDALTGVHNRRWLLEAGPRAIARCERDGSALSLVMCDVDHFKTFNDRYGHLAGDSVLRRVARHLADGLRAPDLIVRFGGEEFVILLPSTDADEACVIAERLRTMVTDGCGLATEEGTQRVTISCGVARHLPGESLEQVLARADVALLRAKEAGRDRVERVD